MHTITTSSQVNVLIRFSRATQPIDAQAEAKEWAERLLTGAAFYGQETTIDTKDFLAFCRHYLGTPPANSMQPPCKPAARRP